MKKDGRIEKKSVASTKEAIKAAVEMKKTKKNEMIEKKADMMGKKKEEKKTETKGKKNETMENKNETMRNKNEIDEIFSVAKKKEETAQPEQEKQEKKVRVVVECDDFSDSRGLKGGKRRFTEDGFPIYSLDELGIGRGGDTDACPFDCECCY